METHNSKYTMVDSKTIHIRGDEVYRTHIEDIQDNTLFFHAAYTQATKCTDIIVRNTRQYYKDQDPDRTDLALVGKPSKSIRNANPLRLKGYPNNIIAFTAHRGHGKTSAMLSFSKALEDEAHCPISGAQFLVLDAIDPTTLEEKDSIIRTIISQMFRLFRDKCDKMWERQDLRKSQQQLVRQFRDCYRLADQQKSPLRISDSYDDLEVLSDHGDSSNLKKKLHDLVVNYLDFMHSGGSAKDASLFLVLQIDDTDMNCRNAYEVVDDIRKYFVVPNVLILFATDIEQLSISVENHFIVAYKPLLKYIQNSDRASIAAAEECRRRCRRNAASYLDKLIPGMHRITLPDLDAELRDPMRQVMILHETEISDSERNHKGIEFQQYLIDRINSRTLLRIRPDPSGRHPFLPKRMRELNHFLFMLNSMEDAAVTFRDLLRWSTGVVPPGEEDVEMLFRLERNLEALLDYFLNDWCDLHIISPQCKNALDNIQREIASQKVAAAATAVMNYSNSVSYSAANRSNICGPGGRRFQHTGWSDFVIHVEALREKPDPDDRDFAGALEIYFMIYKNLVMIHDCLRLITYREEMNRRNSHD